MRRLLILWVPAIGIAMAIVLPISYLILRAAQAGSAIWTLLLRPSNLQILANTLLLVVLVTVGSILIALPLAWLTTRTDLPFRRGWALLTSLPLVIPSYIGAYLMVSALGPRGLLQGWLESRFGIERIPSLYGLPGSVMVLVLLTYPYVLLSVRAALAGMDPRMEEAARVLGQNAWRTFWRVTLPQLRPALMASSLLVALYTLRDFGAVSILRYNTFTRALFIQYQSLIDRSGAAVLALLLILLTAVILVAASRMQRRQSYYSSDGAPARPFEPVRLGRWRWPAVLFCSAVLTFGLILPASVLLFWLLRGLSAGEQIGSLWPAVQNSVMVSSIAALVTLVACLPISVLNTRYASRGTRILERITYLGFALPGVVIALALVFFGANYALFLYQSLPMLIFAYLILFLPQAVGAAETSLYQIHPSLEEAGRSLGKQPLRVFASVTLPLLRPGLAAGGALVFLTVMKELPATLILGPFGFKTLATSVWGAVAEAFFARAAAPALLLILVSSIPMAVLVLRKRL